KFKPCTFDTSANVSNGCTLTNNYMKISFKPGSIHSNGFFNFSLAIHLIVLWQNMKNLFPRKHHKFMNLITQPVNIIIINDIFLIGSCYIIAMLKTANMLSCYPYYYFFN